MLCALGLEDVGSNACIVCPWDEFLEWHAWDCLLGECENCGVENLPIFPIEEEGSSRHLVRWKQFSLQNIMTNKKEEQKKLTFVL
jgi:hypothetical protein